MASKHGNTGNIKRANATVSNPGSQLGISFVGGLCTGHNPLWPKQGTLSFGRGDDCDVHLEGDTVSRVHCKITRAGNAYLLQDLSRNGTYVNGQRATPNQQLRDQDQVRVGQNLLLIHLASSSGTQVLESKKTVPDLMPYLLELKSHIVIKGLEAGVTQPFGEERVTIGRHPDNHLTLDADNVSRHHVCIERRDDEHYHVRDLGSSNGTFLNEQRVTDARLKDDNLVRIGDFQLSVRIRGRDCILNFKKLSKSIG